MKIAIYQINMERDTDRVAFESLELMELYRGSKEIDSSIYDKVFDGEVDCDDLEEVYRTFNLEIPTGYAGRSLSVSDIIEVIDSPKIVGAVVTGSSMAYYTELTSYNAEQERLRDLDVDFEAHDYFGLDKRLIEPGFYFCDSIGYKKVDFKPELAQEVKPRKTIRVVLLEPGKYARAADIDASLHGMQRIVGGTIEAFYPFEEEVCIVCNDEGKINGMELNRAVYGEEKVEEMTYSELASRFREAERNGEHTDGYIVFTEDSFKEPYPEEARTYVVSSDNKAYMPNMGGYSIYGSALDGSDPMVRLERFMADEKGGADGWKIERCYTKEQNREMLDIIAGTCFICSCEGSDFGSLSDEQIKRYSEMFKYPERFFQTENGIEAVKYKPAEKSQER